MDKVDRTKNTGKKKLSFKYKKNKSLRKTRAGAKSSSTTKSSNLSCNAKTVSQTPSCNAKTVSQAPLQKEYPPNSRDKSSLGDRSVSKTREHKSSSRVSHGHVGELENITKKRRSSNKKTSSRARPHSSRSAVFTEETATGVAAKKSEDVFLLAHNTGGDVGRSSVADYGHKNEHTIKDRGSALDEYQKKFLYKEFNDLFLTSSSRVDKPNQSAKATEKLSTEVNLLAKDAKEDSSTNKIAVATVLANESKKDITAVDDDKSIVKIEKDRQEETDSLLQDSEDSEGDFNFENVQLPPVYNDTRSYSTENSEPQQQIKRGILLRGKKDSESRVSVEESTLSDDVRGDPNKEIEMLKLEIRNLKNQREQDVIAQKKNSTISRNDNEEETRYFITWVCFYLLLHITLTIILVIIFSQVFPIRDLFENSPWTVLLGIFFCFGAAVAVRMGFKYSKWLLIILIIIGASMIITLVMVHFKIVLMTECLSIIAAFLLALIIYAKYLTCCEFSCFIAGVVSLLSWVAYFFLAIGVPEVRSWVHTGNIWRNEEPELVHTLTLLILSLVFNMYILWYLNWAMSRYNTFTILEASIQIYMKFMRTSIFFVFAYATICVHMGSMWDRAMNCCSRSSRAAENNAPVI